MNKTKQNKKLVNKFDSLVAAANEIRFVERNNRTIDWPKVIESVDMVMDYDMVNIIDNGAYSIKIGKSVQNEPK